ncbi:hypothetical protein FCM35_KLT00635 [Carex littledalei]|uniref:CCHC-type domain-containing protein n=1 Tax=Carex littledalei TaxID=544730 RepID=A0A833VIF4_9POAL|nr:hypothetical protein FCM35_KLT00635 [Carex littledalei]
MHRRSKRGTARRPPPRMCPQTLPPPTHDPHHNSRLTMCHPTVRQNYDSHPPVEWKGRCFKCCREGHNAEKCRNPKKCGRCWRNSHTGSRCTNTLDPDAVPFLPEVEENSEKANPKEPGFEELLRGLKPLNPKEMPANRPKMVLSYLDRDEHHFEELAKLRKAVVVQVNMSLLLDISIEKIAEMAGKTELVMEREISVATIAEKRFVIFLPDSLVAKTFILAMPRECWDDGFSFQKWDQMEGTKVAVPNYKVRVELHGIPPYLYREKEVVKAVSQFGLYLRSVAQPDEADAAVWSLWTAVVVTRELEEVS